MKKPERQTEMSSWWRGNNSDDEKICNQSRQVVSKCYIKDGKRVCHKETKLVRHCPGEPPQVVESIKEEEEQELGTGPFFFPFVFKTKQKKIRSRLKLKKKSLFSHILFQVVLVLNTTNQTLVFHKGFMKCSMK